MTALSDDWPEALPAPYQGRPKADGPSRPAQLDALVDAQVDALVAASPAFSGQTGSRETQARAMMARIARHAATLALEDWQLSDRLGQRPALETRETVQVDPDVLRNANAPRAAAQSGSGFKAEATGQVGAVTQSTLKAISFPAFVSDLIKGTFGAILDATTTQMNSYMELLENVSKTVEEFENENVSDAQAAQWLAQHYPEHIKLEDGAAFATDASGAPDGIQKRLGLPDAIHSIDDVTIDDILVPAARRKLAQSRLELLSSLVMNGTQRVVINSGRIRASMGFQINASDSAHASSANLADVNVGGSASFFGSGFVASVSTSVTYVSSNKQDSDAALDVGADLTGEVDLHFSTDYMPLNRLASPERMERIRQNTPAPEQNTPPTGGAQVARPPRTSAGDVLNTHLQKQSARAAPSLPELAGTIGDVVGAVAAEHERHAG